MDQGWTYEKERVKEKLRWKAAQLTIWGYCWWLFWHLPLGWKSSKKNFFLCSEILLWGRLRKILQFSLVMPSLHRDLSSRVKMWKKNEKRKICEQGKSRSILLAHSIPYQLDIVPKSYSYFRKLDTPDSWNHIIDYLITVIQSPSWLTEAASDVGGGLAEAAKKDVTQQSCNFGVCKQETADLQASMGQYDSGMWEEQKSTSGLHSFGAGRDCIVLILVRPGVGAHVENYSSCPWPVPCSAAQDSILSLMLLNNCMKLQGR